jgi:hypothetical protein
MNVDRFFIVEVAGSVVALSGAAIVGALFLAACPPSTPAVAPDASDASLRIDAPTPPAPIPTPPQPAACANAQTACDHMKAAGCREGTIVDCARVFCDINADPHFRHYNLACIAAAQDSSAVRGCGADCTP